MTWIVIVVVLLVAFGPILWLVPSRKDRRLTALRTRARAEGLVVDIRRIPKLEWRAEERVSAGGAVREPVIECAAYSALLRRRLSELPGWRVLRIRVDAEADPFPGWRYDRRPKEPGRRYLERMLPLVREVLDELPNDVAGFEVSRASLVIYWLERPGSDAETVACLAGLLRRLEDSLAALEDQIRAERLAAETAGQGDGADNNDS